jgi:hypothetical protein
VKANLIAFANAALAAERAAYDKGYEDCRKLWKQQVEVERERYIELQRQFLYSEETKEFSQLRDQLAAERENWKVAVGNLATIARENAEQLVAEREKVKALVESLHRVEVNAMQWDKEDIAATLAKVKE